MAPPGPARRDQVEGRLTENTFRLASRRDWDAMAKDLRPVYTAVNEAQANQRLVEFHATWGERYPAIKGLWENAWAEFVPFLDYSPEIRQAACGRDLQHQFHREFACQVAASDPGQGHFPNEQAAMNTSNSSYDPSTPQAPVRNAG